MIHVLSERQTVDYDFSLHYNSLMGPCPFRVGDKVESPVMDHEGRLNTFAGIGFVAAIEENQSQGYCKNTTVYVKTHRAIE